MRNTFLTLLPLYDHSINIKIDIYIPINNQYLQNQSFNVLDYCSINTLKYQILQRVNKQLNENKNNQFKLSEKQIKLKVIEPNMKYFFTDWIRDIKTLQQVPVLQLIWRSTCLIKK